jgi:hypothetical protein
VKIDPEDFERGMFEDPDSPNEFVLWTLALLVAIVIVLTLAALGAAYAKPPANANPKYHEWFEKLENADGNSCCDPNIDGVWFNSNYDLNNDGSVTLYDPPLPFGIHAENVEGGVPKTILVPKKNVVAANPTGHAVWWPEFNNGKLTTRCFSPGTLS